VRDEARGARSAETEAYIKDTSRLRVPRNEAIRPHRQLFSASYGGNSLKPHVLVYTSLFPSPIQPVHGMFVESLCRSMSAFCAVSVLNPIYALYHLKNIRQLFNMQPEQRNGYTYNSFPCWLFPKFGKRYDPLLMYMQSIRSLKNIEQGESIDLIHAHYAYPDAVAAWFLSKKFKIPLVVTLHGSDIKVLAKYPDRKKHISEVLRNADAVVAVSENLLQDALSVEPLMREVRHIPNGVNLSHFNLEETTNPVYEKNDPDAKIILAVGRLEPVKGFEQLIRAMDGLPSHYRLFIIGTGSRRDQLSKLISDLRLDNRVSLLGAVAHEKLKPFYQQADCLAISSYSEGWPTTVFESFACGLPVVAPRVGGIPEIINSENLGILIDNNSLECLADGILKATKRVWNKPFLFQTAASYSWDNIAGDYKELFIKTIKGITDKANATR